MIDHLNFGGARRAPFIEQNEASECALACLAMVAGYHDYQTDLTALRARHSLSLKGATLKQLMKIAEAIGFSARPLRGDLDDLSQLAMPAILHWDLNHFVVLTRISRSVRGTRYHIHDPARGVRVIPQSVVSRHFTGVAIELIKAESFKPKVERTRLRISQLWSSMSGFWATMRPVMFLSVLLQLAALASPFYLQIAVDNVVPSADRDLLLMLAIGFGGLALINLVTAWLRALTLVGLNASLSYQIIVNLFRHLVRLPLSWFEKRHVGDVISRFGSTRPITQLLSQGMIAAFIDGLMALMTLALMVVYSPLLAGLAGAALAAYGALRLGFLQALKLRNVDAIATAAKENSAFIESVRGIAAIKAFGQEGNRQRLWQRAKAEAVNAEIKLGRLTAGFDAGGQFVIAIERVFFVYLAVSLALDAKLTIGMIFAFLAYKQQFLDTGMRLVEQAINFRILHVHLSRIADIALTRTEDDGRIDSSDTPDFSQPIQLRDVRFRYGAGEPDVLKGVTLSIAPGELIALVGPSGGGKTTLMKIVMGLFQPNYGQVSVGGRALSGFTCTALRGRMGSVAQDDALYAGSLADNIAFFDPEIDLARVEEVARMAAIHEEIFAMPLRYDTFVGDMGSVLSGGQKQRVLLARALYGRPEILFMDEGTAHLDPASEAKVMAAIAALPITRIISAHRPLAIAKADRVILVDKGVARTLKADHAAPASRV